MAELTPKQRLYVAEYLKDLNAKHAAMRTGYSGKSRANGNRLMRMRQCGRRLREH
ncbi:phage terminase small subunit [Rhizobium leguminosarum]|jgi:phage terminase small subunit|nr:terminase small subunit [Rhizobium leguminosarum]MBA8834084.1 phage terminase small subunit [Rhizobium leguminosarum]MDH6273903.1 phage terminase small subunit [Rhizobium leguminosarum]MVO93100.1 hypothetical protein [Rhizobium leguminosarum bv. phaseoli]TCA29438.1 terminase small subunit [Rhizobium leguminosarum bv. viciae]